MVDEDIPSSRDKKYNRGSRRRTGSGVDTSSDKSLNLFDRPVTELVTAWAGNDSHIISDEHSELGNRPVTESVTERDGGNTDIPSNEHSEFAD